MTSPSFIAPTKDPADVEDYGLDCNAWLKTGETITAQSVTADGAGITVSGVSQSGGVVRWRVSGGQVGTDHRITVRVTASSGRIAERTVIIPVREL
jgi:hypothetical protein